MHHLGFLALTLLSLANATPQTESGGCVTGPISQTNCRVECGVDYPGGDYARRRVSFDECINLCNRDTRCTDAQYHRNTSYCYLKSRLTKKRQVSNVDSIVCRASTSTTTTTARSTTSTTTTSSTSTPPPASINPCNAPGDAYTIKTSYNDNPMLYASVRINYTTLTSSIITTPNPQNASIFFFNPDPNAPAAARMVRTCLGSSPANSASEVYILATNDTASPSPLVVISSRATSGVPVIGVVQGFGPNAPVFLSSRDGRVKAAAQLCAGVIELADVNNPPGCSQVNLFTDRVYTA